MYCTCSTLFVTSRRSRRTNLVKKKGMLVSLLPFRSSDSMLTHIPNVRGSIVRWLKAKSTLRSSVSKPISGGRDINWFSEKSRHFKCGSCAISCDSSAILFLRKDKRVRDGVRKTQSGTPESPWPFCWTACKFDIESNRQHFIQVLIRLSSLKESNRAGQSTRTSSLPRLLIISLRYFFLLQKAKPEEQSTCPKKSSKIANDRLISFQGALPTYAEPKRHSHTLLYECCSVVGLLKWGSLLSVLTSCGAVVPQCYCPAIAVSC